MHKPERSLLLVGSIIVLAMIACSLFNRVLATPTPPPGGQAPTAAPGSTEQAPTQTGAAVSAAGTIDPLQGLDRLPSYSETINLTITRKDNNGNDASGALTAQQDTIKDAKSNHLNATLTGSLAALAGGNGQVNFYTLGGTTYLITGSGSQAACNSFPIGQFPLQGMLDKITDIVGQIHGAALVKKGETVNGVLADHYSFDQSNLTGSAVTATKGDVWVAQDGQYVVKLTGTAVGANLMTLVDPNAQITFDYQVTQVGKVANIALPDICSALPSGIPMPPNSSVQVSVSGFYTLKSSDAPKVVADFFRQQLPAQGWTAGNDSSLGAVITLSFSKGARVLTLLISPEASGATIIITDKQ